MTIDELKLEIQAALAVLQPRIRGMTDLQSVSLSSSAAAAVTLALKAHTRRRDLLQSVLNALDSLSAGQDRLATDGYPDVPKFSVLAEIFAELQEQREDIEAAISEFEKEPTATQIRIVLGEAVQK